MKRLLSGLIAVAFAASLFAASKGGDERGEIGNLEWLFRKGEMCIVGANGSLESVTSITVPPTIEGKTVTKIFKGAFKVCKNLVEVNLPDTITIIDQGAFDGCKSLTEIKNPSF